MGTLTGAQRKTLRGLAHSAKPVVHVGKDGLSDGVVRAIDAAIEAHELVKIKISADRDERESLVPVIEERTGSECVGTVGHMAIFFRRNPDPEKRTIELPGER
mgnify:CR=1 FL=1|jgi:RNA-binding protein